MRPTGSEKQGGRGATNLLGPDPLTTILVGLAIVLLAAVAALGVDLWLWPENLGTAHALAPQAPARTVTPVSVAPTASPSPSPTPSPSRSPTSVPYSPAVRVRIPAIGVDRSIVEVPLAYDSRSKTWERDYDQLFRRGKQDLVGHYGGSASPGQPGNTILVGHNYGYGTNGVFLRLGRLKVGQQVEVVNAAGQIFAYRVTEVKSIPWTKKNQQELLKHMAYLSVEGPERLTLVTCGGSNWAPFPNRVYVVADPVR